IGQIPAFKPLTDTVPAEGLNSEGYVIVTLPEVWQHEAPAVPAPATAGTGPQPSSVLAPRNHAGKPAPNHPWRGGRAA
ncbi:MAG TPA: hypothetical protein VFH51_15445, partial [Myxococcota bacterium]|nr:hypothetical protein [Myxococcota bacterium]